MAVEKAVTEIKDKEETLSQKLKGELELQKHQLTDVNREVEMYQDQLKRLEESLQVSLDFFYRYYADFWFITAKKN